MKGGIDVTIQDVDSFKESVWGKVQKKVKGFGLTAAAKLSIASPQDVDLDFACDTPSETKLMVQAKNSASGFTVKKLKAIQAFDTKAGAVVASPTYDPVTQKGDLSVAFATDDEAYL